jgi:gliding motility-associated-like protein
MNRKPGWAHIAFILLLLVSSTGLSGLGQTVNNDSIYVSSTCVQSNIVFGSTVFNVAPFPNSITWNFGDPSSGIYNQAFNQTPQHIFSNPGTYYVSLAVVNYAGDTLNAKDTLQIITPINYNFGPDIYLCQGQDTLLTAPVLGGANYTWNDDSLTKTDTLRVKQSGVYTVSINGCGVTDSIGVYISVTPKIDLGSNHILCTGENLELNASTQNGHYTWQLNGITLPDSAGQLPVQSPGGQYVSIVNVPGCGLYKDTVSITFSQPNAPAFSLGPDTLLCPNQIDTLKAVAAGATAYDWSTGATDSLIAVTQPGMYWAFVTINNQCQVVDSVEVSYRDDEKLDFHDTAICQGTSLVLNADFGVGQYNWQSTPPQRNDQNQTGQATYYVYNPGKYYVTATVGQCVYTDSLTVTFNDSLRVQLTQDTSICKGEDFLLQISGNANNYTWQDGSSGAQYRVSASGIYQVIAQNGCGSDTLSAKVDFVACSCHVELPNAFTPNGDGHNDIFRALHACDIGTFHLMIYDRYGGLVFQTRDPSGAWDGTFAGAKLPSGNFVWMLWYTSTETKQEVFEKGSVLLIR